MTTTIDTNTWSITRPRTLLPHTALGPFYAYIFAEEARVQQIIPRTTTTAADETEFVSGLVEKAKAYDHSNVKCVSFSKSLSPASKTFERNTIAANAKLIGEYTISEPRLTPNYKPHDDMDVENRIIQSIEKLLEEGDDLPFEHSQLTVTTDDTDSLNSDYTSDTETCSDLESEGLRDVDNYTTSFVQESINEYAKIEQESMKVYRSIEQCFNASETTQANTSSSHIEGHGASVKNFPSTSKALRALRADIIQDIYEILTAVINNTPLPTGDSYISQLENRSVKPRVRCLPERLEDSSPESSESEAADDQYYDADEGMGKPEWLDDNWDNVAEDYPTQQRHYRQQWMRTHQYLFEKAQQECENSG
ncbi:hypothetical protein TruAng_011833 [Truncatella angustata]|nr:hypothetical protein TruAng_011833 [Truncatella angustata]